MRINKIGLTTLLLLILSQFTNAQLAFNKSEIVEYRKEAKQKLTNGDRAPLDEDSVKYLRYYKAKKKYKVNANFSKAENQESFEMPTYSGITKSFVKYGTLTFKIGNQSMNLSVYRNLDLMRMPQYKDYLFLPYKDKTSSKATYGGGRYIDIKTTDIKNGQVVIDFNKSYNPWCAYGDGFNCPVPPKENILKSAIKAGEKQFLLH